MLGTLPETTVEVEQLNRLLLSRTNRTGSDIRIASGEVLNPKAHPRQPVEAAWWNWEHVFNVRWKSREHINLLELRSIFLSVQYYVSHKTLSTYEFFMSPTATCLYLLWVKAVPAVKRWETF